MATLPPNGGAGDPSSGISTARLNDDAARVRADALAAAQRLVESARRSAEEIHEQAARQADAMLRAARAEVERMTEEIASRQALQQISWDAPGRILEAATAEADLVRAHAEARAEALLHDARARAEREAAQVLEAASKQASQASRQPTQELQQVWEELAALRELSTTLVARLDRAWSLLAPSMVPSSGPSGPGPSGPSRSPLASGAASSPSPATVVRAASAGTPAASAPRVPPPSGVASNPATRPEARRAPRPATEPEARPASPWNAAPTGEVDLVLPEQADRMTVEVMIAVLREQPGLTVRAPVRRNQALIVPLLVDRPVPLIPILQELPRVVAAVYSPLSSAASSASGGHVMIELGDR
ncbi:MAG TPA: hypothetical protein VIU62_05255 [Chloroflexota bacterium]